MRRLAKLLAVLFSIAFLAGCSTYDDPAMGGSEMGVEAGATGSGAAGAPPDVGME